MTQGNDHDERSSKPESAQPRSHVHELQEHPNFAARIFLRLDGYRQLTVEDGRLVAVLQTRSNLPIKWFLDCLLVVHGAGPTLAAQIGEIRCAGAHGVRVETEPLRYFGAPTRCLRSSARLEITRRAPDGSGAGRRVVLSWTAVPPPLPGVCGRLVTLRGERLG